MNPVPMNTKDQAETARNQDIAMELEEATDRAKAGKFTDMVLIAFDDKGQDLQLITTCNATAPKLIGLMSVVQARLIRAVNEEIEASDK